MSGNHSRNKYRAKRTPCGQGHSHASRKEAKRCDQLHMLQRAKLISHLKIEPQFWFAIDGVQMKHDNGRRVGFRPDFQYFEDGKNVVEDVKASGKGGQARDYPLRKAIFKALYPFIEFREV